MTDIENKEIRGITGRLVGAIVACSISVIMAISFGVGRIETTFALHEYRISQLEDKCGLRKTTTSSDINPIAALRNALVFDEPKNKMSLNK
jgi:hypothetical protein